MHKIKKLVRQLVPEEVISWYHWVQTMTAAILLGFPSRKMIVIGVTGSKGKTTTTDMLWHVLSATDAKVGSTGTASLRIGRREEANKYHMTMLGRWYLQKYLKRMVEAGCKYAVIETPSEGQKHYRHAGINYDMLIFTNLTDEKLKIWHNNSFEQLKRDNGRVFRRLHQQSSKSIDNVEYPKTIIVNHDAKDAPYYAEQSADKHASFAMHTAADYRAVDIVSSAHGTKFSVNEVAYNLPMLGEFNVINALGAIAAASELHIPVEKIQQGLAEIRVIPGRMEIINEGQPFTTIVDYAHEQTGLKLLVDSLAKMKQENAKIIIHLGAEGGGRDKEKRPIMGEIAGRGADYVIIGNVDPYDDDPMEIIEDVASGAEKTSKKRSEDLFIIEDRRAGIRKALSLAGHNDIVVITGKGAEQSIIIGKKKSAWDDRRVVREELHKLLAGHQ